MGALLLALASCADNTVTPDAGAPVVVGCGGQGRSRCVLAVSVGRRFGCAALADQTVWCWGRNDESQLGYESTDLCPERLANGQTRGVACHMYPLQVAGLAGATGVSAGGAHACAVLATGELRCWGGNTRGQLGNGSSLPSRAPVAVAVAGPVISLATGAGHTCAVVEGGRVYCWGANDRGQLGVAAAPDACGADGAVPCARAPVEVPDLTDAVEVVAGDAHTCVRAAGGRVWCWGNNVDAQLGAGTASAAPNPTPRPVRLGASALRGVVALAAGAEHTCARRADGAVLCWGRHDRGQLGVPVPESYAPCAHACIPTAVPIVGYEGDATSVDAGFDDPDGEDASLPFDAATDASSDAARDAARDVPRDAGPARDAADGAASDAATDLGRDVVLAPPPAVATLSAGAGFSCVSLVDRTLRCWGGNRAYELGNGRVDEGGAALTTVIASPGSASTNPLQGVERVWSGGSTSCALLTDRSVKCWGTNEGGALGVGDVSERNGPVSMTW
jgi:alpha-tubulin suppressor-like RCC1 family protein